MMIISCRIRIFSFLSTYYLSCLGATPHMYRIDNNVINNYARALDQSYKQRALVRGSLMTVHGLVVMYTMYQFLKPLVMGEPEQARRTEPEKKSRQPFFTELVASFKQIPSFIASTHFLNSCILSLFSVGVSVMAHACYTWSQVPETIHDFVTDFSNFDDARAALCLCLEELLHTTDPDQKEYYEQCARIQIAEVYTSCIQTLGYSTYVIKHEVDPDSRLRMIAVRKHMANTVVRYCSDIDAAICTHDIERTNVLLKAFSIRFFFDVRQFQNEQDALYNKMNSAHGLQIRYFS